MQAIILAAGMGHRLGPATDNKPKSLLAFNGQSLMRRHIALLAENGIKEITIVTGYEAGQIKDHLVDADASIRFIDNPRFREGSGISLRCAHQLLSDEAEVIVMDADVLYDPRVLTRLIHSRHENCLLLDQNFIPGDEPVKICVGADGLINEFRKKISATLEYSLQGESVGFFKFNQKTGRQLIERIDAYIEQGLNDTPYEEAIRDLLLADARRFSYEDVSGLAWIEIDFPEDIKRAEEEILPKINNQNL